VSSARPRLKTVQLYGNHGESCFAPLADQRHFLLTLLPGTKPVGAEKHRHCATALQRSLERLWPPLSGGEVPPIEEDLQITTGQDARDPLDRC
jgi:hypothetical protein